MSKEDTREIRASRAIVSVFFLHKLSVGERFCELTWYSGPFSLGCIVGRA